MTALWSQNGRIALSGTLLSDAAFVHRQRESLMNTFLDRLSPSITAMIRADHTHAIAAFHRFRADRSLRRKAAIADHVCLALEIHARLEEEIFYPALRRVMPENAELQKSEPEHDEMKALIAQLREIDPEEDAFDATFLKLMRTVIHHVADEESVLLPAAEQLLEHELGSLGNQMTTRRIQLLAPHTGEAALTGLQTFGAGKLALGAGIAALTAALVYRQTTRRRPHRSI
jgi:hypothetical protein